MATRRRAGRPERPERSTVVVWASWALSLVSGALIVRWAAGMRISRCPDGWSNLGAVRWSLVIVVTIFDAPALGCAAWLTLSREGTASLRRAAVAIAILAPLAAIVLAFAALPAATSTCPD